MSSQDPLPVNSRFCRYLAFLAAASAIWFMAFGSILWLLPQWVPDVSSPPGIRGTLTTQVRLIGSVWTLAYMGVPAWGLWSVQKLFRRFALGLIFEPQTGVLLRRFGTALVIYSALTPLDGTVTVLLVTINNPPGERLLAMGVTHHEFLVAIVGILILTTGSVMADAARMAEENRQIV